jgi:hypothetical protein
MSLNQGCRAVHHLSEVRTRLQAGSFLAAQRSDPTIVGRVAQLACGHLKTAPGYQRAIATARPSTEASRQSPAADFRSRTLGLDLHTSTDRIARVDQARIHAPPDGIARVCVRPGNACSDSSKELYSDENSEGLSTESDLAS